MQLCDGVSVQCYTMYSSLLSHIPFPVCTHSSSPSFASPSCQQQNPTSLLFHDHKAGQKAPQAAKSPSHSSSSISSSPSPIISKSDSSSTIPGGSGIRPFNKLSGKSWLSVSRTWLSHCVSSGRDEGGRSGGGRGTKLRPWGRGGRRRGEEPRKG